MTGEEIAEIMQLSTAELFSLCHNNATVTTVLSLAIQRGIKQGQTQVCENYNRAMLSRDYNKASIQN